MTVANHIMAIKHPPQNKLLVSISVTICVTHTVFEAGGRQGDHMNHAVLCEITNSLEG